MRTFYKLTLATFVAAGALLVPSVADAAFQLKISVNGVQQQLVTDNAVGDMSAADDGLIDFSGTFGAYRITATSGASKPFIGTAQYPQMGLTYRVTNAKNISGNEIAGTVNDVITIATSDTGFTLTPMSFKVGYGLTTVANSAGSSMAYAGNNNVEFVNSNASSLIGPFNAVSSGTTGFSIPSQAGNYSLTLLANVKILSANGINQQGAASVNAVPEPASLAMWGVGALGMMFARKRRQTKLAA